MRTSFLSALLPLTLSISLLSCAQTKKTTVPPSADSYIKLLQGYKQRTVSAGNKTETKTETLFLVVWKGKTPPETFFWKSTEGFLPCRIDVAHIEKNKKKGKEPWIVRQDVMNLNKIKTGDTLALIPKAGGKIRIPAEIPSDINDALFFKTTQTDWLYLSIKNIVQKKDLLIP